MARAIDAEELKETITGGLAALSEHMGQYELVFTAITHTVQNTIDKAPTIDPVKHGKWEVGCAGKIRICSNCEESFDDTCNFIERDWYYCPNCGARMDGE